MPSNTNRLAEINVPLAIAWLALAVLGVQAVFPLLRALVNSYVLTIGAYAVAFVAILTLYKVEQIKVDLVLVLSFFLLMFVAFSTVLTENSVLFNRYFNLICLIAGYPLFRLVVDRMGETARITLFYIIIGFATLTCVRTCLALAQNPYIARSIKSEGEYTTGLFSMGIGGYEIVYFAVICSTLMLWVILNYGYVKQRIVSVLVFIAMISLILYANYMTALIAALIGCLLVLAMKMRNVSPAVAVFVSIAGIIGLTIVVLNQNQILQLINTISGEGRISKVLNSSDSLLASIAGEFLVDRAPVMLKSIDAFCGHPLIGLNALTSSIGASGVISLAGQHSFILDTFAYFGLIGGLIIILAVFMPLLNMERRGVDSRLTTPLFIIFLILLVFNNATSSMAIAALLLPLLLPWGEND